jgi:hypothetical protein
VLRAPISIRSDGAVRLTGGVGEGKSTRFMSPKRSGVLEASEAAAKAAQTAAGKGVRGGLVLACMGRMLTLGSDFERETAAISNTLGAPIGGVCVVGEIARNRRDTEAFHNATTVVLAFPGTD